MIFCAWYRIAGIATVPQALKPAGGGAGTAYTNDGRGCHASTWPHQAPEQVPNRPTCQELPSVSPAACQVAAAATPKEQDGHGYEHVHEGREHGPPVMPERTALRERAEAAVWTGGGTGPRGSKQAASVCSPGIGAARPLQTRQQARQSCAAKMGKPHIEAEQGCLQAAASGRAAAPAGATPRSQSDVADRHLLSPVYQAVTVRVLGQALRTNKTSSTVFRSNEGPRTEYQDCATTSRFQGVSEDRGR